MSDTQRATWLIEMGRHGEAQPLLAAHLAEHPDDPVGLCLMARALLGTHERKSRPEDGWQALDLARRAVVLTPGEEFPLRLVSVAAMTVGRYDEARAAADEAVRAEPDEWRTHLQRAMVDVHADQVTPVTWHAASHAVALAPHETQAHQTMGVVALEMGAVDTAGRALREALRLDPHNAVARHELARLDLRQSRFGHAVAGFADAVALDPSIDVGVYNLTVVLVKALRNAHWILWGAFFFALQVTNFARDDGRGKPIDADVAWLWRVAAAVTAFAALGYLGWKAHVESQRRAVRYLRPILARDRWLTAWAAMLVVTVLGLVEAAAVRSVAAASPGIAVAGVALLVGVVISWVRGRRLEQQQP